MRWIFSPPRPMTRPTSWSGMGYSSTTFSEPGSSLTTSRLAVFAFFAVGPLFSAALSLGRFWPVTPESLLQKFNYWNQGREQFFNKHFTKATFYAFKFHEINTWTTMNRVILYEYADFNTVWSSNLRSSASRVSSLIDCKKVRRDAWSTWAYHDEELGWLKEQREERLELVKEFLEHHGLNQLAEVSLSLLLILRKSKREWN